MTEDLTLDNPLWRFSLRVYADATVRDECLSLQDTLGIDVNLLLFSTWLSAERHIGMGEDDIVAMETLARPWHAAVVLPLRSVRRTVKEMELFARKEVAGFRHKAAGLELHAEQIEQALLFEWAARRWPADNAVGASSVRENIDAYLSRFRTHSDGHADASAPALERVARG